MTEQGPLVVFGPGLGALTITQAIQQQCPSQPLVHLADTTRAPYGSRSPLEIQQLVAAGVLAVRHLQPSLIVLGCNTSSTQAEAAAELAGRTWNNVPPIVEILSPTVEYLTKLPVATLGILATPATVRSNFYPTRLQARRPDLRVLQTSIPTLPALIDSGAVAHRCHHAIRESLTLWLREHTALDALALCCTHYPLELEYIRHTVYGVLGRVIPIISQGSCVAHTVEQQLAAAATRTAPCRFLQTGRTRQFQQAVATMFSAEVEQARTWHDPLDSAVAGGVT